MQTPLGELVISQVKQNAINGILEARARFVGDSYAFLDQSADFKAVHSSRKCAVNLIGTHGELRRTR